MQVMVFFEPNATVLTIFHELNATALMISNKPNAAVVLISNAGRWRDGASRGLLQLNRQPSTLLGPMHACKCNSRDDLP